MDWKTISNRICKAAAVVAVALSPCAEAADPPNETGVVSLEADLDLEGRYDDNIFRSATDVTSSWVSIVSPGLALTGAPSRHTFELRYQGDIAWYADSDSDNYDDHYVEAGAYLALAQRSYFDVVGSYNDAHEDRGTGLTQGFIPALNIPAEPDEYELAKALGRFRIGDLNSTGRFVLEGGQRRLDYTNNVDRTRFFSRQENYADATFYLRVQSKTALLLNAQYTAFEYEYDRPAIANLNSDDYRLYIGVQWDTTAKSSGSIKLGYVRKTFVEESRDEFSGPTWEVDFRLSPKSYSHLDIGSARYPSESNAGGNFIEITSYSAAWEHEWGEKLKSRLGGRYIEQDYIGSAVNRQQDVTQYEFFLIYQMRRWLSWKAGVEVRSRDSNIDIFVFDRNVYSITASFGI